MKNAEIDSKLAEAMGYKTLVENEGYLWEPSTDMSDAWEVAERFGLSMLLKSTDVEWGAIVHKGNSESFELAETAPLAICKAALKVIENEGA